MKSKDKIQRKNTVIERFDKPFEYLGVLQLLFMAGSYAYLWISATEADAQRVYVYSLLMGFEFIMVHSGVLMAVMSARVSLLIFFPFYGVFALIFNRMLGGADNVILILYLTTVFNRMRFAFFEKDKQIINRNIAQSVIAVTVYFFLMLFVVFFDNWIPQFALNETFYKSKSYLNARLHEGMFTEYPYTAICLGTLYFSILAFFNFHIIRNQSFKK